jgi:hypothetical protein
MPVTAAQLIAKTHLPCRNQPIREQETEQPRVLPNEPPPMMRASCRSQPKPFESLFAPPLYTSVVTFALEFVTLTPNCFARAMMSILFLDETLCAILQKFRG